MDSETSNIIAVAADWRAQPGQEETVRQLLLQAAAAVREHEPGNLLYVAHQDAADPTHFLVYEQYADQAALEAHRDSAHYKEVVVGKIVPLLAERQVTFFQLLD
jgi:autoinducer 2-degrading protein